jgi:hypothetical protein
VQFIQNGGEVSTNLVEQEDGSALLQIKWDDGTDAE